MLCLALKLTHNNQVLFSLAVTLGVRRWKRKAQSEDSDP